MTPSSNKAKKSGPMERFRLLNRQHPVLMNIVYILLAAVLLVWLLLLFIDSWTRHGDVAVVPALKGQSIELASMTLENDGFHWEVMDSVFESAQRPGTVVEQNPRAGSSVKPGRTVYLTIVAYSPKMITVPDFMNVSMRQGVSMFEGLGLRVHVVTVASEYKDLVLGAKVNGVPVRAGQRIPVSANIVLEVGGGDMEELDEAGGDTGGVESDTHAYDIDNDDNDDPTVNMLLGD